MENKLNSNLVKDSEVKPNTKCWKKDVCINDISECSEYCVWYYCMNDLLISSGLPRNKHQVIKLTPDDVDYNAFVTLNKLKRNIYDFVKDGNNLYICSSQVGNGKTSWSIKLLQSYFAQVAGRSGFDVKGKFIYVPTFLADMKNFKDKPISQELLDELRNTDVVVWDEVGSYASDYDLNNLISIIDVRLSKKKCNIYTGNIANYTKMCNSCGDRLASRVFNNSYVIELKGRDKRRLNGGKLEDYFEELE